MEEILKKYEDLLQDADYEVICTKKLGWVIIRTDYEAYSDPIKQIQEPAELEEYILSQMK